MTNVSISVSVTGKRVRGSAVQAAVMSEARRVRNNMMASYRRTVATWSNKPGFTSTVELNGNDLEITVGTDDLIYKFIDEGTSHRWALMSRDWRSKTRPGHMTAGPGSGHVVKRGRRSFGNRPPQPGIQAREFSNHIAREFAPKLAKAFQDAINSAT